MMYLKKLVIICLPVLLVFSCKDKPATQEAAFYSEPVMLKYAQGFTVEVSQHFKKVVVNNPWKPEVPLAVYYLVESDSLPTPEDGLKITVPVTSIAISSVTQAGFLDALNEIELVTGSCSPELIYNSKLQAKYKYGALVHLGDAFTINVERTMQLRPSVLIMSGYKQDDPYAARVLNAGIPVVYNNEWMEETALGRAEWIKFMALFVDAEERADSIFGEIEAEYSALNEKVQRSTGWPTVMTGSNFRGTWYMPGGKSYMAQMLNDAGGQYFFASDSTKGSLPLTVESVLANFSSADIWLNCNFNSFSELKMADPKHELFQAVKMKQVYNYNKRLLSSGANDFWESAVVRPDWLLRDLVFLLHPELFPEHELQYYKKLE